MLLSGSAPIEDPVARARVLDALEDEMTGYGAADPPLPTSPSLVFVPTGSTEFDPGFRDEGLDWPSTALTMVGRQRLHNFRQLIEEVIADDVPGDVLEAGVWRGGASILARAVLATWGVRDRRVILADSFEGLPPPDLETYPADSGATFHEFPELAVSVEQVKANFERFDLLDDQVVFVKGWFRDTMPTLDVERLAVLRLDGDMYESTIDPLRHLYDRLSPGGHVIVDDYRLFTCCQDAVTDFFAERSIDLPLVPIDRVGVYFTKPRS